MRNDARFQAKRKGLGKAVLLARLFSKVAVFFVATSNDRVLLPVSAIRSIMTFRK